jgi:hypothetical protein
MDSADLLDEPGVADRTLSGRPRPAFVLARLRDRVQPGRPAARAVLLRFGSCSSRSSSRVLRWSLWDRVLVSRY